MIGDVIIDAGGFTGVPNVDQCEIKKRECIEGNILWPIYLDRKYRNWPIIHISSGCLYSGRKPDGTGWTENDPTNFTDSFYSLCKAIEQDHIDINNHYLLRIRMPFATEEHPKNYITKLKKYPKLINVENSISYLDDIVNTVLFFVNKLPEPGIYNVCNPGAVWAKDIVTMMGIEKEWFTMDEFNAFVKTPRSFCVLNTDKLMKIFPLPSAMDRLREVLVQR